MKTKKALISIALVLGHTSVLAKAPETHHFTAIEDIEFTEQSRQAFDRSGGLITHHHLADGVIMAKHNGSLGNITVARLSADGTIETLCTDDENAARNWMAGKNIEQPVYSLELDDEEAR